MLIIQEIAQLDQKMTFSPDVLNENEKDLNYDEQLFLEEVREMQKGRESRD